MKAAMFAFREFKKLLATYVMRLIDQEPSRVTISGRFRQSQTTKRVAFTARCKHYSVLSANVGLNM